ncbi:RHS repeat-associated core domain-containing protein [Pseudomonas fulva]|uniref:RHS repeat-associated core domain-containing protein n=1 Tax=Pseudomonas fulva TaxID=47880 RepID=UPI0018ABD301|nr:RHS repeat-associated core domain-containing protein [Pseudomonas fulva]MBF8691111.1 hypothetical protein [Pseudomonas fulva]
MTTTNRSLYFYQANRLIAVQQSGDHRSVFRTAGTPLAEQLSGQLGTSLLAVEGSGTVLRAGCAGQNEPHHYTAYGYDPKLPSYMTLLGFNGEVLIALQDDYALGQGHRCFSPVRMRFNTPDRLSPFEAGGLNTYCYCEGDPVNYIDPSGQMKRLGRNAKPSVSAHNASTRRPRHSPPPTTGLSNLTNDNKTVAAAQPPASRKPAGLLPRQAVLRSDNPNPSPRSDWIEDPRSDSFIFNVNINPKPTAVVTPIQTSRPSSPYRQQPHSPASSANSSRDSTPAGSRSSSPPPGLIPDFVQRTIDIRQSSFYSRRHDPSNFYGS